VYESGSRPAMPCEDVAVPTGYNAASMAENMLLSLWKGKAHAVDVHVIIAIS